MQNYVFAQNPQIHIILKWPTRPDAPEMIGDLKSHIGARVRWARKRKQMTQADVAARLGRAVETVSNIERGASWTSLEMLQGLSELLGEPIAFFVEGFCAGQRSSGARLQLEAELAVLVRDLKDDQLRVVRDVARSLRSSSSAGP